MSRSEEGEPLADNGQTDVSPSKRKREATVYDAVAGELDRP